MKKYNIAVLYDYQNVALASADWSVRREQSDIAVFQDHLAEERRDTAMYDRSPHQKLKERLISFPEVTPSQ